MRIRVRGRQFKEWRGGAVNYHGKEHTGILTQWFSIFTMYVFVVDFIHVYKVTNCATL